MIFSIKLKAVCECRQGRGIYCLIWQSVPLDYCSWKVGEFIIISKSEWDLISLVVDMTANSAQRLQIFPSVYSSLVIVDFIEHN